MKNCYKTKVTLFLLKIVQTQKRTRKFRGFERKDMKLADFKTFTLKIKVMTFKLHFL